MASGEGPVFKLRATCGGHTADVRAVAATFDADGSFVSVSRDKTGRLWRPNPDKPDEFSMETFKGHDNYVVCVCVTLPDDKYPKGLVYTGSNDRFILAFVPGVVEPVLKLEGHTNTVSALFAGKFGTLLSGSWDTTAKVWLQQKCVMTLSEHESAVWAVVILPGGSMLTGSADKTIKMWTAGKRVRTFEGHSDCVRALAALDGEEFLSAGNDATIRRWSLGGDCVQIYSGHEAFVYSVCALPNLASFITSGEDRTLRIWATEDGACRQVIRLPAISIWSCCALPNGDIVVGSSDGVVRVFTSTPERCAAEAELEAFRQQVASSVVPQQQQSGAENGVNIAELPGKEDLATPGRREGQTKLIRVGNNVEVYQWNVATSEWDKVGDMVSGADSSSSSNKVFYEGKEYDYVFTVELDGQPSLKLPYDVAEDPWLAAHNWLEKHELSPMFLDQVANFIIANTKGEKLGAGYGAPVSDPFTGGSRYVPDGAVKPGTSASGEADPFTGAGRYVPGGGGAVAAADAASTANARASTSGESFHGSSQESNPYFPCSEFVLFDQAKPEGIVKKLREFNSALEADHPHKLDETGLSALEDLARGELDDVPSSEQMEILPNVIIHWPKESAFPAVDILRLIIRRPSVNRILFGAAKGPRFIQLLYALMHETQPDTNKMLALRCLANAFSQPEGVALMLAQETQFVSNAMTLIATCQNKGAYVALGTVLLNYAVALTRRAEALASDLEERVGQIVTCTDLLLLRASDGEAIFRCVCALGTLMHPESAGGARVAGHATSFFGGCELPSTLDRILTDQTPEALPAKAKEAARFLESLSSSIRK